MKGILTPNERLWYFEGKAVGWVEGFVMGTIVGGSVALGLCALRAAYTTGLCG